MAVTENVHTSCACEDGVDMGTYWNRWGCICAACHREVFSHVAVGTYSPEQVARMNAGFQAEREARGCTHGGAFCRC